MPSFTVQTPNLQQTGPVIEVSLTPNEAALNLIKIQGSQAATIKALALIDTSSPNSVISEQIVRQLNSKPLGKTTIHGTEGAPRTTDQYAVDIHMPGGVVGLKNVLVAEGNLEGKAFQVILGRDVLQKGILIYTGYRNEFTLSF